MLQKLIGVVLMMDGVMSAMTAAAFVDTFVYRNLRDQTLTVAHFVIGALLLLSGRQLMSNRGARLAAISILAAFVVGAVETTRFNWPALVLRGAYTALALIIVYRTTLPRT